MRFSLSLRNTYSLYLTRRRIRGSAPVRDPIFLPTTLKGRSWYVSPQRKGTFYLSYDSYLAPLFVVPGVLVR